jgi:hypothetical protein
MAAEQTRQPHPWGKDPEACEAAPVAETASSRFGVDDITLGPHANGFGVADDGRTFSFRVVGSTMTVRVYRPDLGPAAVPGRSDVEAVAVAGVSEIDLSDERSVVAMVRDMTTNAVPVARGSVLGRLLRRLPGLRGQA